MSHERITATIEDVITAILETEECYNPHFNQLEVLADVAKNAHINLLLAKHQRDKHATIADYEIFFAKHEKAVKSFFSFMFEYDENQKEKKND